MFARLVAGGWWLVAGGWWLVACAGRGAWGVGRGAWGVYSWKLDAPRLLNAVDAPSADPQFMWYPLFMRSRLF